MNNNLQNEIDALSVSEKVELIDALWASLEANPPELTEAQSIELDQRMARYEENPSDVVSVEQVIAGSS